MSLITGVAGGQSGKEVSGSVWQRRRSRWLHRIVGVYVVAVEVKWVVGGSRREHGSAVSSVCPAEFERCSWSGRES